MDYGMQLFLIVSIIQAGLLVAYIISHRETHRVNQLYLGEALGGKANRRKPRKKSSPSNASSEGDGAPK